MKRIKIFFALGLVISLGSCKKLIEIQETDLIAGLTALKTVGNCEQGVIGAYAATDVNMSVLLNSVFADEVKVGEFYNAATVHEWQFGATDVSIRDTYTATNPNYTIIDRVNRVLVALPISDSIKLGDNSLRDRVKGEALYLRAYAHFELFRYYCGNYTPDGLAMTYMTTPSVTGQVRIKMGAYFNQLNTDLVQAKALVPNNLTDINRATRAAVSGLQARVALYQRDWAAAETFATEYITALPLASSANFPGIWTDVNTNEVALRIVKNTGNRMGSLFRGTSASASNIGTITWSPSGKLWNSYDQINDVRFDAYFKTEPLLIGSRFAFNKLIKKYEGSTYGSTNENVANAKVYRTGEMILIRAEARAEQGKFTGANSAETDINALRTARITGYVNQTFASATAAINAIMDERFKELPYEGHRFWDLKRRNLPVNRDLADSPSAGSQVLAAGNFRFVMPIALREIQANPLWVQNPGY
jgi:starch-binding outer membrane protein, SusD/RagB family